MSDDAAFEDLVERFLDARRAGGAPSVEDMAAQYPEHAERLRELLPLLCDLEGLGTDPANQTPTPDPGLPELPGSDYRLLRKGGQGGMGVVYEAFQVSLHRRVAVKILSPSLVANTAMREQFARESQVIAMLHHPNIVQVFGAGSVGATYYYAMEWIDGQGLDRSAPRGLRDIAGLGLQAAKALAYAHACGVLHCDIKPANLLLDSNGQLRVSDFGLAFVLQQDHDSAGTQGALRGTLRYMAPDSLENGIHSFATDQYALGATLYELVADTPFVTERTPLDMRKRICAGAIAPLSCAEPDLAAIIHKCISRIPEGRYPNMDTLAADIQRFLNHEPVLARKASAMRRVWLWAKRKPAMAALGVVSLVCAAAFAVALGVGYARTAAALELARKNAGVADATLSSVFAHIEQQAPSQRGTALLSTLMPYYQDIVGQRDLPAEKIAEANKIIGRIALRAGDYPLAEKAFRTSTAFRPDAVAMNRLSLALRRQGKTSEADALSRQVIDIFAESDNPDERLEAVRALKATPNDPTDDALARAFRLVSALLQSDPANPEYRFEYATILGENPRLFRDVRIRGVEPNAVVLLNALAGEFPDHPDYGVALMDLMRRRLQYSRTMGDTSGSDLATALASSDELLGRFPHTPEVVSSVMRFREAYITARRRLGDMAGARRETERLIGMLEVLSHHPDVNVAIQEHYETR